MTKLVLGRLPMDTVPDKDATLCEVQWRDIVEFDSLDERVARRRCCSAASSA